MEKKKKKSSTSLIGEGYFNDAKLSPDSKFISFTKNSNVFIKSIDSGIEYQLTQK